MRGEETSDDVYWRTQPYQDRIDARKQIREEYPRLKGGGQSGFQRVYSIY
jgi:hypothetical protein